MLYVIVGEKYNLFRFGSIEHSLEVKYLYAYFNYMMIY